MQSQANTLIDLERKFWQSMVDNDTDTALEMLCEPSLMVSAHGAMKFGHAKYRKMAEQGSLVLNSYELSNMEVVFPNEDTAVLTYRVKQQVTPREKGGRAETQNMHDSSTWIKTLDGWKCVMHTETPVETQRQH